MSQIEKYRSEDPRPLPLLVAEKWGFDLAFIDQDGNADRYLYSARDWFIGLGGEKSGWAKFDKSWLISNQPVEVKRKNRKPESLDFVLAEDLYRIAQDMRAMAKRPQLQEIKDYLAAAGVLADQARRKPQETAEKLLARAKGIEARNLMTTAAQETHETHRPFYGKLTDVEYQILLGATKQTIVERLNFNKSQTTHFRDQLGALALKALEMAETASAAKMRQQGRALTHEEQLEIVRTCARMVAPGFHQLADYLGVDRIQNNPLLGD